MADPSPAAPAPRWTPRRLAAAAIMLLSAAALIYLLLRPAETPNLGSGLAVGQSAPAFTATTLDGQPVSLADLSGKLVVLNFWATWCPPCREEMPYFNDVYEQYKDQGLVIIGINLGESEVAVRAFLQRTGVTFPVIIDQRDRLTRLYDVVPLPTTYVIGPDGRIRARVPGLVPRQQLEEWVRQYL